MHVANCWLKYLRNTWFLSCSSHAYQIQFYRWKILLTILTWTCFIPDVSFKYSIYVHTYENLDEFISYRDNFIKRKKKTESIKLQQNSITTTQLQIFWTKLKRIFKLFWTCIISSEYWSIEVNIISEWWGFRNEFSVISQNDCNFLWIWSLF